MDIHVIGNHLAHRSCCVHYSNQIRRLRECRTREQARGRDSRSFVSTVLGFRQHLWWLRLGSVMPGLRESGWNLRFSAHCRRGERNISPNSASKIAALFLAAPSLRFLPLEQNWKLEEIIPLLPSLDRPLHFFPPILRNEKETCSSGVEWRPPTDWPLKWPCSPREWKKTFSPYILPMCPSQRQQQLDFLDSFWWFKLLVFCSHIS